MCFNQNDIGKVVRMYLALKAYAASATEMGSKDAMQEPQQMFIVYCHASI